MCEAWSSMMGHVVDTEFLGQIEPYLAETDAPVKRVADLVRVSESWAVVDSPSASESGPDRRLQGGAGKRRRRRSGVSREGLAIGLRSAFSAQPTASRACSAYPFEQAVPLRKPPANRPALR